jgi:hypothetical protein
MNSFFIFDGLERLRIESEVDHDIRMWGRPDDAEEDESLFEEDLGRDPQLQRRWERLLARHALVRQARGFIRACAALGKELHGDGADDRDAALLMRSTKRLPQHLAEALIAEVNGRAHRDCDSVCVAYDIEWLMRTRRALMQALGALERLLTRYPAERSSVLELVDQGKILEAAVAHKTIEMCVLWVTKQEAERRPK